MRIIYIIVKALTLPGAMLHAFFEHLSCRSQKIIVEDARVLQMNEMLGHIDHPLIKQKGASFDICFIPFFLNFMLGLLTLSYGSTAVYYYGRLTDIFAWVCLYLGISLWTNLFPQVEDVMMIKENYFNSNSKKLSKILVAPFYGIFFVGSRLEQCGLSLITSIAASLIVPHFYGWFVPAIYNLLK